MSQVTASTDSLSPAEVGEIGAFSFDTVGADGSSAADESELLRLDLDEETLFLDGNATSIALGGSEISTVDIGDSAILPVPQPLTSGRANRTATEALNDNPNDAIGLALGNWYPQTIDAVGDSRWFATITTATVTKLTTALAMASGVDFDLYIYKLSGNTLNLVAFSEIASAGAQEVTNYMAAPGTYFFRVVAYSGTGGFAIYNFASDAFDAYELNESLSSYSNVAASGATADVSIVGNIDNPLDKDFYSITLPPGRRVAFELISSSDADYVAVDLGTNTVISSDALYELDGDINDQNEVATVYVEILSLEGYFDDTVDYTFRVKELPHIPGSALIFASPRHSVVVERILADNGSISELYINGHLFNWYYHWVYSYSNSSAGYTYMVDFSGDISTNRILAPTHVYSPNIDLPSIWLATYSSNLNDHEKVFTAAEPALIMGFDNIYAYSTRTAYGSYAGPGANWDDTQYNATVVIDPSTGSIIDVIEPNCLYDRIPWEYSFNISQLSS
ncbi:MAG: hypothetical protein LBL49_05970 [Clostridiales Family XIII bacterium]|nr:hypothetical protein [Clostridiales Family XIII bacterium]